MLWPLVVGTEPLLHAVNVGDPLIFHAQWFDPDTEFYEIWFGPTEDEYLLGAVLHDVVVDALPQAPGSDQSLVIKRGQMHALLFRPTPVGRVQLTGCLKLEKRPSLARGGSGLPVIEGHLTEVRTVLHEMELVRDQWVRVQGSTTTGRTQAISTRFLAEEQDRANVGTPSERRVVAQGFLAHVEIDETT